MKNFSISKYFQSYLKFKDLSVIALVLIITLLGSSCITIQAPPLKQGIYSYYAQTVKVRPDLFDTTNNNICDAKSSPDPKVMLVSGNKLISCIQKDSMAIVYLWNPNCKSENCISPDIAQNLCNEHSAALYVVAQYFDADAMSAYYEIERPIFAIDPTKYGSNRQKKYIPDFIHELTGKEWHRNGGMFLLFEKGKCTRRMTSLEELDDVL